MDDHGVDARSASQSGRVSVGTGTRRDPGTDMYDCCGRLSADDGPGVARVGTAQVAPGRMMRWQAVCKWPYLGTSQDAGLVLRVAGASRVLAQRALAARQCVPCLGCEREAGRLQPRTRRNPICEAAMEKKSRLCFAARNKSGELRMDTEWKNDGVVLRLPGVDTGSSGDVRKLCCCACRDGTQL